MARISTPAEIKNSILDLRRVYSDLSDERFAIWYSKRYKVSLPAVKRVLQGRMIVDESEEQPSTKTKI